MQAYAFGILRLEICHCHEWFVCNIWMFFFISFYLIKKKTREKRVLNMFKHSVASQVNLSSDHHQLFVVLFFIFWFKYSFFSKMCVFYLKFLLSLLNQYHFFLSSYSFFISVTLSGVEGSQTLLLYEMLN